MRRVTKASLAATVTGLLGLLGPWGVAVADADSPLEQVQFTVDNVDDAGDANPGDGRCSILDVDIPPIDGPGIPMDQSLTFEPGVKQPSKKDRLDLLPTPYPSIPPKPGPTTVGLCTLRAAIDEANASASPDVYHMVTLPSSLGVYRLTKGQLRIEGHVHIGREFGPETARAAVNAGHRSRVFDVAPGVSATFDGLFIAQGKVGEGGSGAGIRIGVDAHVNLRRSVIVHNIASQGGGISVARGAFLDARSTSIEANSALLGGGLYSDGVLEFEGVSISANRAATGGGMAIDNGGRAAYLRGENLSILDNVATGSGGGLLVTGGGWSRLLYSTVAGNAAGDGGGIKVSGGELSLLNVVVADNTDTSGPGGEAASPDCAGAFASEGERNMIGVVTPGCTGLDPLSDLLGSATAPLDPRLEPIQISVDGDEWGWGGEMAYRRPARDSPLLNQLSTRDCHFSRHDMIRYNARSASDGACDLGAIER